MQHFPEFSDIFGFGRYAWLTSNISEQLFHILFYMRFSVMRFSTKVFEHAKITRWSHCNADSLKMPKASYMLTRLLWIYRMTKYVGKILLWNSKRLLRKLQKTLGGYFFLPHPVYYICYSISKTASFYHAHLNIEIFSGGFRLTEYKTAISAIRIFFWR